MLIIHWNLEIKYGPLGSKQETRMRIDNPSLLFI